MVGFESQSPAYKDGPRKESPGEAQVRLANWFITIVGLLGIRYYPFEMEAQAVCMGPWLRRFKWLREWKAPKTQ